MNFVKDKPIILIDTSYLTFYRYYATITWFKSSKQKENIPSNYKWFEDKIFMEKFNKLYLSSVTKIIKKNKLDIPFENHIFALDCSRSNIWRSKFFNEYKIQRDEYYQSDDWQGGPVFAHVVNKLLPELKKKYNFNIIKHPKLEADDIIACITRFIQNNNHNKDIYIITNDNDYLQLINPKTTIINLKNKKLNDRSCGNPQHDLLIKIICGDSSDNIKGCFKRCGYKTALKYIQNNELLEKAFHKNPDSKKIFEFNRKLIDFNFIPQEYKDNIINLIKNKI